jgi:acyl carrier protein
MDAIMQTVKDYIVEKYLPGQDPRELTEQTPLITSGILDSLGVLELVAFLEARYGIEFAADELDPGRLNTLESIAQLVRAKSEVPT